MATIIDVLNAALKLHQEGNLDEAERLYREVLKVHDGNADAWHLLGHVAFARGDVAAAIGHVNHAIRLDGTQANFHHHLAEMYLSAGQLSEAETCCRAALGWKDDFFAAHHTLGTILLEQGQVAPAIDSLRRAISGRPDFGLAHANLGNALRESGKIDEAIEAYRQALRLDPCLVAAEANLAAMLQARGELSEAIACYRRVLQLQPNLAEAHCALGVIFQKQDQFDEATACYLRAIQTKPDFADAYNNLGTIYRTRHQYAEALECYQRALESRPNFAEALTNVGHIYKVQGRVADASVCYDQSLRINPRHPMARYSRAVMLLASGDFARGWKEYESRWECEGFVRRMFQQPVWNGEPLSGRTLLVHSEQALGDTIQFARFVRLLQQFGGPVIFEIPPALEQLFKQSGFDNLLGRGQALPHFDVHLPLLSAPRILGTTLETIPAPIPYLLADPQLVASWGCELGRTKGLRVGIAWQGNAAYLGDRYRSIPLSRFAPLAQSGVEFVSLQKGAGVEQLAGLAQKFAVRDFGPSLDKAHGPFMDTAAIMKNLDLVVTSDTAIAHLAGALGVQVWVALPLAPDWRWMYDRTDSPWYPTMRLFRQSRFDQWPDVFEQMAAVLKLELTDRV
jgi:tetratricopeptide (TPR) repeat protein